MSKSAFLKAFFINTWWGAFVVSGAHSIITKSVMELTTWERSLLSVCARILLSAPDWPTCSGNLQKEDRIYQQTNREEKLLLKCSEKSLSMDKSRSSESYSKWMTEVSTWDNGISQSKTSIQQTFKLHAGSDASKMQLALASFSAYMLGMLPRASCTSEQGLQIPKPPCKSAHSKLKH